MYCSEHPPSVCYYQYWRILSTEYAILQGCVTPRQIQFHSTPFHAIPRRIEGIAGNGVEWRAVIWSSELELYWIGIVIFNGIGVAWREAGGRVEWRGVTPGNDLGLVKNCTIPRTIPLAWRGVTLSTSEELDRNGLILQQSWERGMAWNC